jgi:alcohol dehydrogenase (NADP+)
VSSYADEVATHVQSLDVILNTVAAPHDLDVFFSLL